MPVPKDVMRTMVHHVESTMPIYRTRFHDIAAVKAYILTTSAADALESGRITYDVLDSVTYQVALRAYESGEFYLDAPPPDKRALRSAIGSAVSLTLPQIGSWPSSFTHVQEVKTFIGIVCAPIVDPLTFPTLSDGVFKDYVLFQTARQAWEERKYEMRIVPEMWHRAALRPSKMIQQEPKSLADAISLNIHALRPLLLSLPPFFHDLNAARNYIGHLCTDNAFQYTYWPDVEERKFRCFVHFNAAKWAWQEGRFGVSEEGEKRRLAGGSGNKGDDGSSGKEVRKTGFGVSSRAYGEGVKEVGTGARMVEKKGEEGKKVESGEETGPIIVEFAANSSSEAIDGFDFLTSKQDDEVGMEILEFGNETSSAAVEFDSSAVDGEAVFCDSAADIEDEKKVVQKIDPFKNLLYDLKRTAILKAAFE